MTRAEFEELYDVRLIPKSESWLMSLIGRFSAEFKMYYTTYRLPGQRRVTITYPDHLDATIEKLCAEPDKNPLGHELVHVLDFARWWGPWFMALVIFPPGRWYVKRHPYLEDIRRERYGVIEAVAILWDNYRIKSWGWPSPRRMHAWFTERL